MDIVYYFSLTVKADGEFDRADPGWSRLKDFSKIGKKQGLTISCMKQEDILSVVNNPAKRQKVVNNTLEIMNKYGLTELNLDFEYAGTPPASLTKNYTSFVREFKGRLPAAATLSVATFADAVWKIRMYDIPEIAKFADFIIVMAYDFTRPSSTISGPVAPLFGKEKFEYDVYSAITGYIKTAPPEKIVLGIPFYGYEWVTVDNQPYAFTLGQSGALSTIKRTTETIKKTAAPVMFDRLSQTPWLAYQDQGRWKQVWFENERSLGLKLDLVNQAELAGLAIWALGYEGNNPSLWEAIRAKL